jgi:heme/copper-type cytochrome/quinol oxidase subunit 2
MNMLSFLSFLILAITLLTMVFGSLAYFLYKIRDKKKNIVPENYEEIRAEKGDPYLFFSRDAT